MNTTMYRVAVFLICLVVCKSELHDINDKPKNIKNKENGLKPAFKTIPKNNQQVKNQNTVNLWQYPNLPISIDNAKERMKRTVSVNRSESNKDFKAIENTKRYKRMNYQEIPDPSLLNNEGLRANVEKVFGTNTALEPANEDNPKVSLKAHSKDDDVLRPEEVQANIEEVFGKAPNFLSQRMGTNEPNNPQSQTSAEPNANEDETKPVQQTALQTLILQNFGPEVLDKDPSTIHEATNKSNEGSISVGEVTPTLQETTPKTPDTNNGQNIRTGILVYVACSIAVALFFV